MNWNQKCRLCLTDNPQRPIHSSKVVELGTMLKDFLDIEILKNDKMDLICSICMETLQKIKFFKSNQNVVKECRGFCNDIGIKNEQESDDDCLLIEDKESNNTLKIHDPCKQTMIRENNVLEVGTNKTAIISNEPPKMKDCRVLVCRLQLNNNKIGVKKGVSRKSKTNFQKKMKASISKLQMNGNGTIAPELSSIAIISPEKCEALDNLKAKASESKDICISQNKILVNKMRPCANVSSLKTVNIPKIITPVQQSIKAPAKVSNISHAIKSASILKLPPSLKITQIPNSKITNIGIYSMSYQTSSPPVKITEIEQVSNRCDKNIKSIPTFVRLPNLTCESTLNKTKIEKNTITANSFLNTNSTCRPSTSISAMSENMLQLKEKLQTAAEITARVNLSNNKKVKVLTVNELNNKSSVREVSRIPPKTVVGVVNPNNSNATELTVRFLRQKSKLCIIVLLYGRVVTFNELDSQQRQYLKRLLVRHLKTREDTLSIFSSYSPDEETMKLLKMLKIDHLQNK